jgi:hypothetical protein
MDGTKISLSWPRVEGDPATIASKVRSALEGDRLKVDVGGHFLLIPIQSIKYIQLTPGPQVLPDGVVKGAQIVD